LSEDRPAGPLARRLARALVPESATCMLNGTYVKGTLKVERNASLAANGVRVIGNVQAENHRNVVVQQSSRVGGSVQVKQGGSGSVLNSQVTGDIQYDANRSYLRANNNCVGGSIQIVGNTGGAEVYRNTINGNFRCKENRPVRPEAATSSAEAMRASAPASRELSVIRIQSRGAGCLRRSLARV
jgi:hypothetical protein